MCGRYALTTPAEVVARVFGLGLVREYPASPRYNIAPTQMAPVIRVSHTTGERVMRMMRWGLVPHWSKDDSGGAGGAKMINARAETLTQRPAYRTLLERRRCLVPADAFYEWMKPASSKDRKQPFAMRLTDNRVFAFAGLWDRWKNAGGAGEKVDTYTIVTTAPNELAAKYHDRMPVMLIEPAQWDRWLDESVTDAAALQRLLVAPQAAAMRAFAVSPRVNSAVRADGELNDDPGLLAELAGGAPPQREPGLFE